MRKIYLVPRTKLIGTIISERQKTKKQKNPKTSGLCEKARDCAGRDTNKEEKV